MAPLLNANRAYYLTRSQPPFLTSMIMAVYEARKNGWPRRPRVAGEGVRLRQQRLCELESGTAHRGIDGLARYYDFGKWAGSRELKDEAGSYRKSQDISYCILRTEDPTWQKNRRSRFRRGFKYSTQICDVSNTMAKPDCEPAKKISLSPDYYKGDRSMRESGFDISFRSGPYGAATHHYAPICLNSLLYKTEKDLR